MLRLENVIQDYRWGSRTAIAELLGEPSPSQEPQAEMWMGAHPKAPSRSGGRALSDLVAATPEALLGTRVVASFGPRLPFLLKVLAAAEPLSLQAHPTVEQAAAGFVADEAAGIAIDADDRNYRDRNHKPELICALTPFAALCAFRPVPQTLELLDVLAVNELGVARRELEAAPDATGVRRAFTALMDTDDATRQHLIAATVTACRRHADAFADEREWAVRLAEKYPGDIGVVSSLLLNLVRLAPGEAIYLPAGNLHAYLEGTGVEVMASSDNVLRGGLTPKHVNVPELLRVLDFAPLDPPIVMPRDTNGELVYPTPAREFQLGRLELGDDDWTTAPDGPEILLCTAGTLVARATGPHGTEELPLPRGASLFVPAATERYVLSGRGTVFRTVVP
jgi:mannose-6-phosphate isomerase